MGPPIKFLGGTGWAGRSSQSGADVATADVPKSIANKGQNVQTREFEHFSERRRCRRSYASCGHGVWGDTKKQNAHRRDPKLTPKTSR